MKEITFTKLLTVNLPPIEVENWPGYRTGLPNLPGINLVLAHRTAKRGEIAISLPEWGVYDEESGFYLGVCARTRNSCYEAAVKEFEHDTPESYVIRINMLHCKRITTILTGGMK